MITLYTHATPNGQKASILLEELGLPYRCHALDLVERENLSSEYRRVSPIGKLPAILEQRPDGGTRRLFGSGAILQFYAEETGRLIPVDRNPRAEMLSWLALGISDLGPTALDMFRFSVRAPEKLTYAIDLFKGELIRCYQALEEQLADIDYLAGSYTIADIACFPFIAAARMVRESFFQRYPHLQAWHDRIAARPAVQRGMAMPAQPA